MSRFNVDDSNRLCAAGDRLAKENEGAQHRLQKGIREWEAGAERRETLAARLQAFDYSNSRNTPDFIAKAREISLRQQLDVAIREGDGIIVPLAAAAESAKQKLFQFNARVAGAFSSWANRVIPGLPAGTLRDQLEDARHKVELMYLGRTGDILAIAQPLIDAVEEDETIDAPIFRVAPLITQALGGSTASI
jgi:hypothetical protein